MSDRAALIISCSRQQAATIHQRAELERRTVSGYVLRILMRWLDLEERLAVIQQDRKSTRLNSSHGCISYAVFCLKKKKPDTPNRRKRQRRRTRAAAGPLADGRCPRKSY